MYLFYYFYYQFLIGLVQLTGFLIPGQQEAAQAEADRLHTEMKIHQYSDLNYWEALLEEINWAIETLCQIYENIACAVSEAIHGILDFTLNVGQLFIDAFCYIGEATMQATADFFEFCGVIFEGLCNLMAAFFEALGNILAALMEGLVVVFECLVPLLEGLLGALGCLGELAGCFFFI